MYVCMYVCVYLYMYKKRLLGYVFAFLLSKSNGYVILHRTYIGIRKRIYGTRVRLRIRNCIAQLGLPSGVCAKVTDAVKSRILARRFDACVDNFFRTHT